MKAINLSKREKVLLYILVCLLLFVIGWYLLFLPASKTNTTLKNKYAQMNSEYQQVKGTMELYGNIDTGLQNAKETLALLQAQYYPYTVTEDIDKLLTTAVQKHGLVPVSLTLEEATGKEITAFLQEVEKVDETMSKEEKATKEKEIQEQSVKVMNVTQVVSTSGFKSNISGYVEAIHQIEGVKLSGISYVVEQEMAKVTFKYTFYMIKK